MKSLLETSDMAFAEILVEGATCLETTNEKDCNKGKACLWDVDLDECGYGDWRRNYEDSPCAKAAPLYFDYLEADVTCQKIDSKKRCERNKQCIWYSEESFCESNFDFVFFGINNIEDKVRQVIASEETTLRSEYEALPSSDNFTWQSFLDYKPTTECPSSIEPLVCKYVDALMSGSLGPEYYCSEKYMSDASGCRADALCRWNTKSAECIADRSVVASAELTALTVLTDSMPDGQDKQILEAVFACQGIFQKDSCNGTCIWHPSDSECRVRDDHTAALLTEAGKNTTDALCTLLTVDGFSDCFTQFSKKKCQNTELCLWNAVDECQPKNEFYVSAAADRDPKLNKRYQRLKKQCSSHTTEKTCEM